MGNTNSTTTNITRRKIINEFYRESKSRCLSVVTQDINNVTIYLGPGSEITNTIFTQKAEQNVSCMLNSSLMDLTPKETQSLVERVEADTGLGGYIATNLKFVEDVDIFSGENIIINDSIIRNIITQIITTECNATSHQLTANITVFLSSDANINNLEFTQNVTQDISCSILNMGVINSDLSNGVKTDVKKTTSIGVYDIVLVSSMILIVIILLIFIFTTDKNVEMQK